MIDNKRIVVLYGSQTFTAQELAEKIWRMTKALEFRGPVQCMDEYPISDLIREEFAIFVCATAGKGDEPDNMKKFWKFLLKKTLPSNSLVRLKFGVLALGDSSFSKFNWVGKKLHKRLLQLGATPLMDVGLCDYQHDLGHDAVMIPWLKKYWNELKSYFPNLHLDNIENKFVPRWRVELLKNNDKLNSDGLNEDIYFKRLTNNFIFVPKQFVITDNIRTTDESHFQDCRLMSLKCLNENKLSYKPGDILNLRPRNSKEDIEELFEIFRSHNLDIEPNYKLSVKEMHEDMPVPEYLKEPLTLYEVAEQYWDLKFIPTQYVFTLLALVSEDKLERDKCIELSSPEGQEEWLNYCRRPRRTIIEVLQDFHKSASKLTLDVIFELFSPIKPRSFSIASSCLQNNSNIDILFVIVKYFSKLKKPRLGLASNWLGGLKIGDQIWAWLKEGSFVFPNNSVTPCILIGPGTGMAPFRSLLLERDAKQTASKDALIFFFGCRYKEKDFHCRTEMEELTKKGAVHLICAFSRDYKHKVYVQHKMSEHRSLLWDKIKNESAIIFISGNAKNMPDNVRDAFIEDVFMIEGDMKKEAATLLLKNMENEGRLQVETW